MKRYFFQIFALVSGLLMVDAASAANPITTREVLIPANSGGVPNAWAIASTPQGDVIVGGNKGVDAWAAKVAPDGRILWSYDLPRAYKIPYGPGRNVNEGNEIHGVVPMPDGSTFVCGNAVRPPNLLGKDVFLAKLDAKGNELARRTLLPPDLPSDGKGWRSLPPINVKCIGWRGMVVVVGEWERAIPATKSSLPITERFHWVMALDANGGMKWNKLFVANLIGIAGKLSVVPYADGLLFSATDSNVTDAVSIDKDGKVVAYRNLKGAFAFVEPIGEANISQMFGIFHGETPRIDASGMILINMDAKLQVLGRSPKFINNLFYGDVYRMPDNSVVVIGRSDTEHGWLDGVIHADPAIVQQSYLELPRNREPIFLKSAAYASTATLVPGRFASVRSFTEMPSEHYRYDTPPVFRGAVIDFIRISH